MSRLKSFAILGWANVCLWSAFGAIEAGVGGRTVSMLLALVVLFCSIGCIAMAASERD